MKTSVTGHFLSNSLTKLNYTISLNPAWTQGILEA
jgi:hypothetical protein